MRLAGNIEGRGGAPVGLASMMLMVCSISAAGGSGNLGSDVCAGCHKEIAKTQRQTNMALTWQGAGTQQLPPNYFETHSEGPGPAIEYSIKRTGQNLEYRVQMPGEPANVFPVETTIGGKRHGISFLFRVPAVDGLPLPRARLIEGRYFHYARENRIAHSLGFPDEKPTTYETAFGRVLTPFLEVRCLTCHGEPRSYGTRVESGVGCENCHGPGQAHLVALGRHSKDLGILNPDKQPVADRMRQCAQCHAGSSVVEDPLPDDLLISDQVMALKNSECWRQSGGEIWCTNCHNPHQDASRAVLDARAERTCLRCHSATVTKHAGLCPVNRVTGCVGCHLRDQIRGAFVIADHWIRVPDKQGTEVVSHNPAWRTRITPKHLFLRMIVVDDREKARSLREQLRAGGSFFDLARANSMDHSTAVNGGYMGDLEASQFDAAWSATAEQLEPGEISEVVEANGKYVILQRLSRNFREDAEAVFNKAMDLRKQGKQREAVNEMLEALKIYPHLLRGLTWLGAMYGEAGNPNVSVGILSIATRLYPGDAGAHYNLALAYGAAGNAQEIPEYQRAIEIEPDYVLTYLAWGTSLYAKGQYDDAIKIYRNGLDVNPLFASLHYNLGLALEKVSKNAEAEAEMALAAKIDAKYARH